MHNKKTVTIKYLIRNLNVTIGQHTFDVGSRERWTAGRSNFEECRWMEGWDSVLTEPGWMPVQLPQCWHRLPWSFLSITHWCSFLVSARSVGETHESTTVLHHKNKTRHRMKTLHDGKGWGSRKTVKEKKIYGYKWKQKNRGSWGKESCGFCIDKGWSGIVCVGCRRIDFPAKRSILGAD